MKRKKELIVVLTSLLVIVLSVSVAYFTTKILGTGKDISVTSADLKVIFTSGSGTINGTNIEPGWTSGEKTFTVKNESNGTYKYNIIIKDLVNTFVTEGFLQYRIVSTDGGYNMRIFENVPKSLTSKDKVLAYNISIDKDATHTYIVEFIYQSTGVDQSEDMGKTLTGKIFIEEAEQFKGGSLSDAIMFNNPIIDTRSDFYAFEINTANTLYKSTENGADVYYFAGKDNDETPINNWVKFGKFGEDSIYAKGYESETSSNYKLYSNLNRCTSATEYNVNCSLLWKTGDDIYWRIIRTNHDSSIRLLFSGSSPDSVNPFIFSSEFNPVGGLKSAGYMYGNNTSTIDGVRENTNDSTIKTYIDYWYEDNLTSYTNYLSNDAIYCNDRELQTSSVFKSYARLYRSENTPTYDCTNTKDAFSGNNEEAKLKYPIALMTADEIIYAGGIGYSPRGYFSDWSMWYSTNSLYQSYFGKGGWWTMTPAKINYIWNVGNKVDSAYASDMLSFSNKSETSLMIRPVTSLKSCVQWKSGDGSANAPYEIEMNGGC